MNLRKGQGTERYSLVSREPLRWRSLFVPRYIPAVKMDGHSVEWKDLLG